MKLDEALREKYNLPDDWAAYDFQCIPKKSLHSTHIQVTGSRFRLISKGKRKGQKIWIRNECEKSFVFTNEEYKKLIK